MNQEADIPEGLPLDIWNRLVESRDRKIASEMDIKACQKRLNQAQYLVSSLVEENEVIRQKIEEATKEQEKMREYKFQDAYNIENLFTLKQGQVII